MAFTGFGTGVQEYFTELGRNNQKAWFEAQRSRYETEVLGPAEAFIGDLGSRLSETLPGIRFDTRRNGAGSLMRINRDIRFSPDKRPYKENLGIIFWFGDGKKVESPSLYFHIDAATCFFYGGQHVFPKETLLAYREAVAGDTAGTRLTGILSKLEAQGLKSFEEPSYKRVPNGYPADHPRSVLLRSSGLGAARVLEAKAISQAALVAQCADDAARMKPLLDWIMGLG